MKKKIPLFFWICFRNRSQRCKRARIKKKKKRRLINKKGIRSPCDAHCRLLKGDNNGISKRRRAPWNLWVWILKEKNQATPGGGERDVPNALRPDSKMRT